MANDSAVARENGASLGADGVPSVPSGEVSPPNTQLGLEGTRAGEMARCATEQQKGGWPIVRLTEGLLLATLPALAYGIGYAYELGYADAFRIPRSWVVVDLTTAILALLAVGTAMGALWGYANHFVQAWKHQRWWSKVFWILCTGWTLFSITKSFFVEAAVGTSAVLGLACLLFAAIGILRGYVPVNEETPEGQNLYTVYGRELPHKTTEMALLVAACGFLAYAVGGKEALTEERFLVRPGSPDAAVLRTYGNKLVCAPFDRSAKRLANKFILVSLGDGTDVTLNLETVGPLRPPLEKVANGAVTSGTAPLPRPAQPASTAPRSPVVKPPVGTSNRP